MHRAGFNRFIVTSSETCLGGSLIHERFSIAISRSRDRENDDGARRRIERHCALADTSRRRSLSFETRVYVLPPPSAESRLLLSWGIYLLAVSSNDLDLRHDSAETNFSKSHLVEIFSRLKINIGHYVGFAIMNVKTNYSWWSPKWQKHLWSLPI